LFQLLIHQQLLCFNFLKIVNADTAIRISDIFGHYELTREDDNISERFYQSILF